MADDKNNSFEKAGQQGQTSLWREFFQLLKTNKKYWMIPLIVALLLLGLLVILGSTAAAPFIYTLF